MWHSPSNVVTTRTFFKRGPHHHSADKPSVSLPPGRHERVVVVEVEYLAVVVDVAHRYAGDL
jgi:FKBP-type peptidyl-prolyl cis-trans isomerase 2